MIKFEIIGSDGHVVTYSRHIIKYIVVNQHETSSSDVAN